MAVIIAATGFATRPQPAPETMPPPATRGAEASGIAAAPVREAAPDWSEAAAALEARYATQASGTSEAPDAFEASTSSEVLTVLEVLEGTASFYANSLAGRRTASGARYNPRELVAAHRHLPFGTVLRVTNPANDRSVEVRVIDRGPFTRGRVLDLSRRAAEEIGIIRRGHAPVRIEVLSYGS